MSLELGFLWLAEVLMVFALGCFVNAFRLRRRDLARHMFWGKTGAYTVFAGLVAVELVIRVLKWEMPVRSETALHWHIGVASLAALLLVVLLATGLTRRRALHVRLYPVFLPAYALTVLLSFFAFRLW
jgi:hypothetical protein